MSVEREGGKVVFMCDTCPETTEPETGEFNEAWDDAKQQGWHAFKVGDEWCHACPDCSTDPLR